MVKRGWKRFILYFCLTWSMMLPAFAADLENIGELPYDGYLFRLKENTGVQLFSMSEETNLVCEELGVYQTNSLENIQDLIEQDALAYVEPNYYLTLFDAPNDPRYSEQWEPKMIGAETAWDLGLDGAGVRIGIIDSGYTATHEELAQANILEGHNYIDDSTDTADDVGHGTFVTGIIAAQRNNGVGIAGIADGAQIVPLKAFSAKKGPVSAAASAIIAAVDEYDCDILNMSWGMPNSNNTLKAAIEYAADAGVILIAAVGNDGNDTVQYPAGYDNVIGVGAVDIKITAASFSQKNESVDVVAPGASYLGLKTDGTYRKDSGTSFACPTVTAMVAMLLEHEPEMNAQEVTERLTSKAIDLGDAGWDASYGYGLVTMPEILQETDENVCTGHTVVFDEAITPTCTETGLTRGAHCTACTKVLVKQSEIPASGHTEVLDEAIAPSCTETGLTAGKHCSVCNAVLVAQTIIDATGHNLDTGDHKEETAGAEACHTGLCNICQQTVVQACFFIPTVVEPTCTEPGYTWNLCKLCGYDYYTDATEALGHSYVQESVSPTCTEQGYTKHTCSCGDYYLDSYVEASGHLDEDADYLCDRCNEDLTPPFEVRAEDGKLILVNAPDTLLVMIVSYENGRMTDVQFCEAGGEITISAAGDTVWVFFLDSQTYIPIYECLKDL